MPDYFPPKPWLDLHKQVLLLKSRRLFIEDEKEAMDFLRRFGYYRLSGYSYPLRENGASKGTKTNTFKKGSTFNYVISLYDFDKKLRLLMLDALERIEISLRVSISYYLGKNNPVFYKDKTYFSSDFLEKGYDLWIEKQKKKIRESHEDCIRHNIKKYGEDIPVWVVCQSWDFGQLTWLLKGLNATNRQKIGQQYGFVGTQLFISWLISFNQIRNICAHHSRLWNRKFSQIPKDQKAGDVSSNLSWCLLFKQEEKRQLFFLICGLVHFLKYIEPGSAWADKTKEFLKKFPNHAELGLGLKDIGALNNWEQLIDQIKMTSPESKAK